MPIPYDKLTYNDILHHQAAYECFDKAGKELFPDWDIIGFEKAVLGCGDNHYLFMAEQIKKVCVSLSNGTVTYVSRRYVARIKQLLGI